MDMVNDGKDIRLDTPQAVKEVLASGKDLYNHWKSSIPSSTVHLQHPLTTIRRV